MSVSFVKNDIERLADGDVSSGIPDLCTGFVFGIGFAGLLGWIFDFSFLKSFFPGQASIKFNSAVCLVLMSISLWFNRANRSTAVTKKLLYIPLAVVFFLSLLTLIEYTFGPNLSIDEWAVIDTSDQEAKWPGRMSGVSAYSFLLLSLSIILIDFRIGKFRFAQLFSGIALLLGFFGILGYIFGVTAFHSLFIYSSISVHTAIAVTVLSIGILFIRPNVGFMDTITKNSLGGIISRRLIPAAIILPIVIGWIRLKGQEWKFYETEFGLSIMVFSMVFFLCLTIWLAARYINTLDEIHRRSDLRIASIINSATDAIISKNLDGIITGWNPGAEKIFGYSKDEMIGKSIMILIPPDRINEEHEIITRIERGESVEHFDTVRVRKDGNIIAISVTAAPLRDENGKIIGASKFARDITERKNAEKARRDSEERFYNAFHSSPAGMAISTFKEGRFVDVNETYANMFGYSRDEMIGRISAELGVVTPESREEIARLVGKYGSLLNADLKMRTKGGEDRDVYFSSAKVEMEDGAHMLSTVIDITARKQAEVEIRKSEEKYRTLFDTLIEGFCTIEMIFDDNGKPVDYRFLEINPAFEKQTGLHNAQGKLMRELAPDHEQHWFDIYGKIALTGEPVQFENEAKALGRHYDVCAYRVGGEGSRKVAILFNDITERKKAEDKIHQLNTELEQRVIERTARLEAVNKELESFSYSVSHDLRTPLRAIDGFSQALVEDYAAQLPDAARRYLDIIRNGARSMGELIDDLLEFSRLGRANVSMHTVDMNDLVHHTLEKLNSEKKDREVELLIENLPHASGDFKLLQQVWINLLSNAFKYSRKKSRAVIQIGSFRQEKETVYFVKDNGAGFDMRYAHKLFGVFQRLHLAEEYDGTGVGLALVQRIIQKHGGRIWAEGKVDEGATFYFALQELESE